MAKKRTIRCKNCGAKREVFANNYREVTLCIPCLYEKRRKYNTDYVRAHRKSAKRHKRQ